MPANLPPRTTVVNRAGDAWNKLVSNSRSHQPIQSDGMLTGHTIHGVIREPEQIMPTYGPPATPGESGIGTQCELLAVSGDTLIVREIDDSGITADTLTIAKPYELRQSITTETIEGVVITYVYDNAWTRAAYISGAFIETQIIIPRYTVGGRLQYIGCDHTGLGITKIDVNIAGRAWARKYV